MSENIIEYGLCNVHYATVLNDDIQGNITYGTPKRLTNAKSLSLKLETSENTIYADNTIVFKADTKNGYKGEISLLSIPDEFRKDILGEKLINTGALIETSELTNNAFALMFQFEGDKTKTRHILYKCFASLPELASKSTEDKTEANEFKLELTVVPLLDKTIKLKMREGLVGYDTFFDSVMLPQDVNVTPTPDVNPVVKKGGRNG